MNENIKSYLDHYFQLKSPSFAVLIKGSWGSGKTWFLKRYIKDFDKLGLDLDQAYKSPFLFVSLYGVNSTTEIDEKLFEQLHPILGSTPVKIGSKFVQNLLKLGISAPVAGSEVSGSLPEINLKSFFTKFDDKIIVFDDVERSNLNLRTLFGYINNFIELKNQRTVLLANEEEITDKELFKRTQEKIIGKTFLLASDIQNAITAFYNEIKDPQLKTIITSNRELLVEIFSKVGKSNLRNLRQTILHFEYLFKLIGPPYNQNIGFIAELITPFVSLSLQFKNGDVDIENWKTALNGYIRQKTDVKTYAAFLQDKSHEAESMYGELYLENVPLIDLWPDLVIKGDYDNTKIKASILNAKYFVEETIDPLTKLMRTFRSMRSKEFSDTVDLVLARFNSSAYTHPGDILHVFDILALFSKWGLIGASIPKLRDLILKQVEKMRMENKIEPVDIRSHEFSHFGGFSFSMRDTKEFKSVFSKMEKITLKVIEMNLKATIRNVLDSIPESFLQFCRDLCRHEGHGAFASDPVLSLIDAEEFVQKYFGLNSDLQNSFIYALKDRYQLKYDNGKIEDEFDVEYEFICRIILKIGKKLKAEGVLNNPPNFMLKGNLEELLKVKEKFDQKFGKAGK